MDHIKRKLTGTLSGLYSNLELPAQIVLPFFLLFMEDGEIIATVNKIIEFVGRDKGKWTYAGCYMLREAGIISFDGDIISGRYILFKAGSSDED